MAANLGIGEIRTKTFWKDDRWNRTDLGTVLSGVFHGPERRRAERRVRPAGRARRNGNLLQSRDADLRRALAERLFEILRRAARVYGWSDSRRRNVAATRGQIVPSSRLSITAFIAWAGASCFAYRIGDVEMLDSPWVKDGNFERVVAPAADHPLRAALRGGPPQWPQELKTTGQLGSGHPYAVDTIQLPFENPWNALLFVGDHDFLPDGSAPGLHDAGRCVAGERSRSRIEGRPLAAVRRRVASAAGPRCLRGASLRPRPRSDHAPARPERRRRSRLLRMLFQQVPHVARRSRFHLRSGPRSRRAGSTRRRASKGCFAFRQTASRSKSWRPGFEIQMALRCNRMVRSRCRAAKGIGRRRR